MNLTPIQLEMQAHCDINKHTLIKPSRRIGSTTALADYAYNCAKYDNKNVVIMSQIWTSRRHFSDIIHNNMTDDAEGSYRSHSAQFVEFSNSGNIRFSAPNRQNLHGIKVDLLILESFDLDYEFNRNGNQLMFLLIDLASRGTKIIIESLGTDECLSYRGFHLTRFDMTFEEAERLNAMPIVEPWWAPAGVNRGKIEMIEKETSLNFADHVEVKVEKSIVDRMLTVQPMTKNTGEIFTFRSPIIEGRGMFYCPYIPDFKVTVAVDDGTNLDLKYYHENMKRAFGVEEEIKNVLAFDFNNIVNDS